MRKITPQKNVSILDVVPRDLLSEVLRRVAVSSLTDLTNAKLSCKELNELGEEKYVYQHVSLEDIPIVQWRPLNPHQATFMNRCLESGNVDVIYRQALVEYFNERNVRSAVEKLDRAVKAGHMGAFYVACIVLMANGDEESKEMGIRMLSRVKKSGCLRKKLGVCRRNVGKQVRRMWVYNRALKERRVLCHARHLHRRKSDEWEEYDVDSDCPTCGAAAEIDFIRDVCKFC